MYPPPAALSDAVFSTPARLAGGPAPPAPAPPQPDPKTRKARVDLEYLAGGDRWGTLGGYLKSLPTYIDDLTKEFGPDLYDRMQLDDQVSSSLRALVFSVLSDDLVLRPGIDDRKDPDFGPAKVVLAFMERATWEGRGGTDEWLYAMARGALGGGNRVSETVLRAEESGRDAGKLVLDRLAVKPRRSFAFVVDAFNRLVGLGGVIPGRYGSTAPYGTTFAADGPPPPNLLPREKFCVLSWDPPDGEPRGSALLRCVYEPWWAKLQVARDHLANLAQFGSPSLVATTAPGADSSAATDGYGNPTPDGVVLTPEQDLLNQALAFRNGTVIVLPNGATLEALTVPNAGKAFAEKIDACDRAIAQGILLAMRAVMQSRFGSRADAEQGQDVAGLQTRFMKRWLARMVTEDLLRYIYRVNYGPNADPRLCPYASLSPVEHQDLGPALVAMTGAWKAGFLKNSQLPWAHEQFGMPPATPEELAAPAPPQAPPGVQPPGAPPAPGSPPVPPQAPFAFDPEEPRVPAGSPGGGEWTSGAGGGSWEARDAARADRREAAERAREGYWDTSGFAPGRKALEEDPSPAKAEAHAALYPDLWRAQEAELQKAGMTGREAARAAKVRGAGEAAVAKRVAAYAAAHARHQEATAALAAAEEAEPGEPGADDYPAEPEDVEDPDPDDYDGGEGDPEYEAAVAAHAAWEKARDGWEAAYAKVDEDYTKDHDRWEARAEKARERADAAEEKAGDAVDALTEALDLLDEKFNAVVHDTADAILARIDAEEEADPEPDEPEAGFAFNPDQPRVPAGSAEGGEWGSGGGGAAVADKPAPKKPRVDVGLTDKEEVAIARIIKGPLKIKGGLTGEHLAALGGAPDGGQATVRPGADKKSLAIHVSNDFTAVRHLRRLGSGELVMENESIHVKESEQGKGLGTEAFARQVDAARALGVDSIRCHAARYDALGREAFNGYSTWPKLGYDQSFEDLEGQGDKDVADGARAAFPGVEGVLQLMAVPGGKHWWAKNGTDLHKAKFDLSDGSDSMLVLEAYLDARKEDLARG